DTLRAWAQENNVPMIGVLRETQNYVRCIERGQTLFDAPRDKISAPDIAQWEPITQWLKPVVMPAPVAEVRREPILPVRKPSVLGTRPLHDTSRGSVLGESARPSVLGGRPLNEAARAALTSGNGR